MKFKVKIKGKIGEGYLMLNRDDRTKIIALVYNKYQGSIMSFKEFKSIQDQHLKKCKNIVFEPISIKYK